MENNKIWEEKSYIEQEKNCLKSLDLEQSGSTTITENQNERESLKTIIETKWARNCPNCRNEIIYSNKYSLFVATRNKSVCRKCIYKNPVTLEKVRIAATGKKHTPEEIEKIRAGNLGRVISKETREKLRDINLGKKHTEDSKEKMSLRLLGNTYRRGKKQSEEVKQKISNSLKGMFVGDKNPMYGKVGPMKGKHHTDLARLKMSKSRKGKKWSEEQRIKCKEIHINRLKELGIFHFPGFNNSACEYFDWMDKWNGWSGRYASKGGEYQVGCYFVDYYEPRLNIVVEYDEPNHYCANGDLKKKDIDRMIFIKKTLQCRFYRYNSIANKIKEY